MTDNTDRPQTPSGLNHIVINVRDLEAAHDFWTGILGFRHVGTSRRAGPPPGGMRFYSGEAEGKLSHHHIALYAESTPGIAAAEGFQVLDHVAIAYPSREAWEAQLAFLKSRGIKLTRRIHRGATWSAHLQDQDGNDIELVYELPRAFWENDIDNALNTATAQPLTD